MPVEDRCVELCGLFGLFSLVNFRDAGSVVRAKVGGQAVKRSTGRCYRDIVYKEME